MLIDRKSVFYQSLFDKGIVTLENLVTDTNVLLVRQDPNGNLVLSNELIKVELPP